MRAYTTVGYPLLLVIVVTLIYGQFLGSPMLFDDLGAFAVDELGNQHIASYQFGWLEVRALPMASLAWSVEVFGLNLRYLRVGNLLLHAAVAVALYIFLHQLFAKVAQPFLTSEHLGARSVAFFAALIFALHPIATYAAGYLVQRTILMSTLFAVLAMWSYVRGSLGGHRLWLWLTPVFYYFAVFSKEHAIVLPVVLLALTVLLHPNWLKKLKQCWAVFAVCFAIALLVLLLKKGLLGFVYEPNGSLLLDNMAATQTLAKSDTSGGESVYLLSGLTQSWLFFKYAALWLLPNPAWMSIDMREAFSSGVVSRYLLALIGFMGWGIAALWMLFRRDKMGLFGFAMLFPWVMFLTEFSTVRIQEVFVLYRSYLWAVGACCILPVIISWIPARLAAVLLSAIALLLIPISMERLSTMSHPVLLWDDAEKLVRGREDVPGVYRIYYNRGTELIKMGDHERGLADLQKALVLAPELTSAYNNIGSAYLMKKEWGAAVEAFSQVIRIAKKRDDKLDFRPYAGRAMAYKELGEMQKAMDDYLQGCKVDPAGCSHFKSFNDLHVN